MKQFVSIDFTQGTGEEIVTGLSMVRAKFKGGYIEVSIDGNHLEVRCNGDDLPCLTVQPQMSNSLTIHLEKGIERQ
jgi:hypothetical protein